MVAHQVPAEVHGDRQHEMFRCEWLNAKLRRLSCARQHLSPTANVTCQNCPDGTGAAHAREFGLITVKLRKQPEKRLHRKTCVRCEEVFECADGRMHYCHACQTPRARIKSACERAEVVLRLAGHRVDHAMTPNGAVLIFHDRPERAEEVLSLLVECGFAVRVTQIAVGAAIHVLDAFNRAPAQTVKIAIGEQRMRRRAPPRLADEVIQHDFFGDV